MTTCRSLAWKRRLGTLLGSFSTFGSRRDRRVILIYHSVGGGPWSTPVRAFEDQLNWLSDHTDVVSLEDLLSNLASPESSPSRLRVSLTFDDGYRSLYDTVAPRLEHFRLPATVYVNTGYLGDLVRVESSVCDGLYPGEQFLTWREVRSLSQRKWTVGSHGVHHVDLTAATPSEVDTQLRDSKAAIESQLGRSCDHFSYTWGRHNSQLRESVARVGYRVAVAGHHAPCRASCNRLALPRLDVRQQYSLRDFADLVTGNWDFLGVKHRLSGQVSSR